MYINYSYKLTKGNMPVQGSRVSQSSFISKGNPHKQQKRYLHFDQNKSRMTLGSESPCRQPYKMKSKFKYLDLLVWKKIASSVDSRWDKCDYLGIEKLRKDYTSPKVLDEYNYRRPLAKRSWWHRPFYYRTFAAFMLHENNMKKLRNTILNILVFKGDKSLARYPLLKAMNDAAITLKNNSYSVTQMRLQQVAEYLQYLKIQEDIPILPNKHVLPVEDEIQKQAQKFRIAWREDWKDFWRANPPLERWESPRALPDPDPHIPFDSYRNSLMFNDILWRGSGVEDYMGKILSWAKSNNPFDTLRFIIASGILSPKSLDSLINIREEERRNREHLGSIHRGSMDIIYEYIPGWNHATHTYDLGRRTSMQRTMREEEEIRARYPDALGPNGRIEALPPYMEMLYQWKSYPDPVYSKFAHIDPVIHAAQLKAFMMGDLETSKIGIPSELMGTENNVIRPWLYIYSAKEGVNHQIGNTPNILKLSDQMEQYFNQPDIRQKIIETTGWTELFDNDKEKRMPLTSLEAARAIEEKRNSIPEWKVRLLTNESAKRIFRGFMTTVFPGNVGQFMDNVKRFVTLHLPELILFRKHIPKDIKRDLSEYKESLQKHIDKNYTINAEKLKYTTEKRKEKNKEHQKRSYITSIEKSKDNNTTSKRYYTTSSNKESKSMLQSLKEIFSASKELRIFRDEFDTEIPPKLPDIANPLKIYHNELLYPPFPKITLDMPEVNLSHFKKKFNHLKNSLNEKINPPTDVLIGPKIPLDSFEVEMSYKARQRASKIKEVIYEFTKEHIMKNSSIARRLARSQMIFSEYALFKPLNAMLENEEDPVKGLAKAYLDNIEGNKIHHKTTILDSLFADPNVRIALVPEMSDIRADYLIRKEQIDHEVNQRLYSSEVDEAEYFLEYVRPFIEELENDPTNLRKKRNLLLRLEDYSRMIPTHPGIKTPRQLQWEELFSEYLEKRREEQVDNDEKLDFSKETYKYSTPKVETLEETLAYHGIFLNSIMHRMYPLRQNRWYKNIIYGPDGMPFDLSNEVDLHKLEGLVNSFHSAHRALDYSRSLFWMKQIRKMNGKEVEDPFSLDMKNPKELLRNFVKSQVQMAIDRLNIDSKNSNLSEEQISYELKEKKEIIERAVTLKSLVDCLTDASKLEKIWRKEIPSHSGSIQLEGKYTKEELFVVLFLRSCVDGSIRNYKPTPRLTDEYFVDPNQYLFDWLLDHYKSAADNIEIVKSFNEKHTPTPKHKSLVAIETLPDLNYDSYAKVMEFLEYFTSYYPTDWISGIRLLSEDKTINYALNDVFKVLEKMGNPESDSYMELFAYYLAKSQGKDPADLRGDYQLQIEQFQHKITSVIENLENEDILMEKKKKFYGEDLKEMIAGIGLDIMEVGFFEESGPDENFAVVSNKKVREKEQRLEELEKIKSEEKNPLEEKMGLSEVNEYLEKILKEESEKEPEYIIPDFEEEYMTLTEEEKALIDEVFDYEKLEYMFMERKEEFLMDMAGFRPYIPGVPESENGFPYDIRDVLYSPPDYSLSEDERNDPEIQRAMSLGDPTIIKIVRALKVIENGGKTRGGSLLIMLEILCQTRENMEGSTYKVPPRVQTYHGMYEEEVVQIALNEVNEQVIKKNRDERFKALGFDYDDFIFDHDAEAKSEDPFAKINPVTNRVIENYHIVDDQPFKTEHIKPLKLTDLLRFEMDLRKNLKEENLPELKDIVKSQFEEYEKSLIKKDDKVVDNEKQFYSDEEPKDPYFEIHESLVKATFKGFEEGIEPVIEEAKAPEETEEVEEEILETTGGLMVVSEEERRGGKELAGTEEKAKSLGVVQDKEEMVKKIVGNTFFHRFGFTSREEAQQDTTFLKLMKALIPNFSLDLWMRVNKENFFYIVQEISDARFNIIRLVTTSEIIEDWISTRDFENFRPNSFQAHLIKVYVEKDMPMADYYLDLYCGRGIASKRIEVFVTLKIDYKSDNYFFIQKWKSRSASEHEEIGLIRAKKKRGIRRRRNLGAF